MLVKKLYKLLNVNHTLKVVYYKKIDDHNPLPGGLVVRKSEMQLIRMVRAGATVKVGFVGTRDKHGRYIPLKTLDQKSDGIFLNSGSIGDWVMLLTAKPANPDDN